MKDTRKKILETACFLLAKYGYPNFSYGLIAENMQISKGLIAYHFPQKPAIFQSVMENYFAQIAEALEQTIRLDGPAAAILQAYISGVLRYVQEHKVQTLAVMEILSNERGEDGELIYQSGAGIDEPVRRILCYGQETEEFFRFDPPIMTKLLRSLIDASCHEIAHGRCEDEDYFISQTVSYMIRMVKEN